MAPESVPEWVRALALARDDDAVSSALQAGDPGAVDRALLYLETDRWGFRTGYVKQRLFRYLRHYELTHEQRRRLHLVLVACVDVGDRSEFGEACRCARRFEPDSLRDSLMYRFRSDDLGVSIRAMRMLTTLRHPRLSEDDRDHARDLLLVWASGPRVRYPARWVSTVVRRLWASDWGEQLVAVAIAQPGTPRSHGARQLLVSVSRPRAVSDGPPAPNSSAP